MKKSESAPVDSFDTECKVWTRAELAEYHERVFYAVVEEYVKLKALSPIVSSVVDPDGLGKSTKLTYDSINHIVDIERVTEKALERYPHLQPVWFALALGEPVDPKLSRETVMRCGRIYSARKIAPWHYHKSNRYAHRRPQ